MPGFFNFARMLTIEQIKWDKQVFWSFSDVHVIKKRCTEFGIECETYTPKKKRGGFGKAKSFYFIDGDEREFLSADELIEAYNDKFKRDGDSPIMEVKYIKVIKKRK